MKIDGSLWAWGNNEYGQLGIGTTVNRLVPTLVGTGYVSVSASGYHTLALKIDGSLWAWGINGHGVLGDGTTTNSLVPKLIGTGYASVAAGWTHTVALKSDGSLWTWGYGPNGRLGDGTDTDSFVPKQIGTGYVAIAAGSYHSFAWKSDGSLWAWGFNGNGALGDGTTTDGLVPKQIATDFTVVFGGGSHTVALKSDGSLWAWGFNGKGALGDGTTTSSLVPKQIGSGYASVSAGIDYTIALKSDGSLWAWGLNNFGELGDGTTTSSLVPKQIDTGYTAVSAGRYQTVALKSDGSLWAWGYNGSGQLGDGTTNSSSLPHKIDTGYNYLPVLLTGITLTPATVSIGDTSLISPIPIGASVGVCTSSDTLVATVSGTTVTGIKQGSVIITCSSASAVPKVSAPITVGGFSDNGDGTVSDPATGLMWKRCAEGQTWTGSTCSGTAGSYTWDQANALTGTVSFAGQSDWRLPNIRELQTIVDRTRYNPAIDPVAFPNTPASFFPAGYFWSGSLVAYDSSFAWVVVFNHGDAGYSLSSYGLSVRLVRGGQSFGTLLNPARPTTDYVNHGNGTVTHTPTGLMWQRCAKGQTWSGSTCSGSATGYTWDAAVASTDTFAGYTDWHLPTEEELVTLVDYTSTPGVSLNSTIFPNTSTFGFWSGSPDAYISNYAWWVDFSPGLAYGVYRGNAFSVRLVRAGKSLGNFATLYVNRSGTGSGDIASVPAGITCGATCSASFSGSASITLTATPATGSTFSGWSGACTGTGNCLVNMSVAQSVTATFNLDAPTSLTLAAPSILQSDGSASLTATAGYGSNISRTVKPTWSTSDATVATISPTGLLSAGSVSADTLVTINASYTENGTTVTASKTITITAARATLASLAVTGGTNVQPGGQVRLGVTATYSDGSSRAIITVSWSVSPTTLGSVNSRGVLTVGSATTDTPLTVTASYTEGTITQGGALILTIKAVPPILTQLTVIGGRGTLKSGDTLSLAASGNYNDGSRKTVSAAWRVTNTKGLATTAASISSAGVLTAASVTQDTPVLITATYSQGAISTTAEYLTLIQATAVSAPVIAEVEATGSRNNYSVAVWVNTATPIAASQFAPTTAAIPFASDANAACGKQASGYRLADWNDLTAYYAGGGDLAQLVKATGFDAIQNAWISYGGSVNQSTGRKYFVAYHNHATPIGFFSYDDISNRYFELGSWNDTLYALCFNASSARAPRASQFAASSGYKLYVAAIVPGGGILGPAAVIVILNRSHQWNTLSWPMAEFMSGVTQNSFQLVTLFENFDSTMISGTQFYVGYGSSDTEMLSAGRYKMVYQVP